MEYPGPELADFSNVRSLNREYLLLRTRQAPDSAPDRAQCADLARGLQMLRPAQCDRLAATPFLLFSFRERDDDYWNRLLDADGQPDLFVAACGDDAAQRLIAAGLGFVWQLARQNPYAARLICGASMHWCEQLAERTLFEVVAVAAASPDVLVMREADNDALWRKLLEGGTSSQREIRRATHISALQFILTSSRPHHRCRPAIAARAVCASSMKVADDTAR